MVNSYKRTSSPRSPTNTGELFTPAHEENVRFIHDTWQCVLRDIRSTQNSERNDRGPQDFYTVDLSDLKKRNTQDSKKTGSREGEAAVEEVEAAEAQAAAEVEALGVLESAAEDLEFEAADPAP
ncbi:hypothetical protein INR49_011279 [Caranx melampygus]|nr:hypothetical protein INR49_011279 [Caranx melampygus]